VLGSESPSLLLKISTCDHGDRELPTVFEINVEDMITLLLQVADLEEILKGMIECSTTKEIKDQLIERLTDRINDFFVAEVYRFVPFGKGDGKVECDIRLKSDLIEDVSTLDGDYVKPTLSELSFGFEIDRKELAQAFYEGGFDGDPYPGYLPSGYEDDSEETKTLKNCPVCSEPLDDEGNCPNECVIEEMMEPDEGKCPECGKPLNRGGNCPDGCI